MGDFENFEDEKQYELDNIWENYPSDFIFKSSKDHKEKVHKKILSLHSPIWKGMITSKNSPEYKSGCLVLEDVKLTSMKGLVHYLYDQHYEWMRLNFNARPRYFADLWNLAENYQVKNMKAAVKSEFRAFTEPDSGEKYEDEPWRYARDAVDVVCKARDFPDELWLEMVKEWAKFRSNCQPSEREEVEKIVNSHAAFARAVRDEAARGGY
ncbi:hypothetical protein PRZ48_009295 [Zasmidium cellare]|uniref:BTB domain-containing protein n=1 Tax=Zasmidium cellare TaxID=395010 RepID=A0ABR0EBB7_ZASCE|nr:hypothetical protein PRZ48_009295 [Zasmidium cellare]